MLKIKYKAKCLIFKMSMFSDTYLHRSVGESRVIITCVTYMGDIREIKAILLMMYSKLTKKYFR